MDKFSIDYENLDVETIMAQIRQRVKEKKGTVYSDAELQRLAGLELPSPTPPKREDPNRNAVPVPEMPDRAELPEGELPSLERILTRRMQETKFEEIQDDDFVTEALRCVGEWNINITLHDLYRSSPGFKGKIVEKIRSINRKLFKLTMNIDVLFPQFHRQAVLNQTYVQLFHNLVKELTALQHMLQITRRDVEQQQDDIQSDVESHLRDLRRDLHQVDQDLKQTRGEFQRDMANDKNDLLRTINEQNNTIEQLQYTVDNLRGLIEGQKQQIEYLTARQRALEKLAVLKEEPPDKQNAEKSSDLKPGRYKSGGGESEQ